MTNCVFDQIYTWESIGEALSQGQPLTVQQRQQVNAAINRLNPRVSRSQGQEAPDPLRNRLDF